MISPINGTNCTPVAVAVHDPQGRRDQGPPRRSRGGSGAPAPLFVNLVIRTKQKRVGREHGARLRLRGGRLEVRRYR